MFNYFWGIILDIYSCYRTLATFPVLYKMSSELILYIVVYISLVCFEIATILLYFLDATYK